MPLPPLTVTVTERAWAVVMLVGDGVTETPGGVGGLATSSSTTRLFSSPLAVVPVIVTGNVPVPIEREEVITKLKFWLRPGGMVIEAGNWIPISGLALVLGTMVPLKPFNEVIVITQVAELPGG